MPEEKALVLLQSAAQTERASGYQGRDARDVLSDMDQIIAAVEEKAG